jgi:hypothetical protein
LLQGEDTYQLHQPIREFFSNKQINLAIGEEQKANFCQALVKVAQGILNSPTTEMLKEIALLIFKVGKLSDNQIST